MGQKINPNLFQLIRNNKWKSKYLEKKCTESSIYSKKDKEIRNFIFRFFKIYRINIHNCHLYYLKNSLHVSLCYHSNSNNYCLKAKTQRKKTKYIPTHCFLQTKMLKVVRDVKLKNCFKTRNFLSQRCSMNSHFSTKFLLRKLSVNLSNYLGNNCKIFLVLKDLKFTGKQITLNWKARKLITKNVGSLRKYYKSKFFKIGINVMFHCVVNKNSSQLLAWFIAIQLKTSKRHNFFIRFVKSVLKLFKSSSFSKFKGIKIEIKGRLNGKPRARNKTVSIGNSVSVSTINSIIDYSEKTAFTSNGTMGVKVWIQEILF